MRVACLALILSGCALTPQTSDSRWLERENRYLKARVADLTKALERQERENRTLQESLKKQESRIEELASDLANKPGPEAPRVDPKNYYLFVIKVQEALKNAGFNPGLIDGRMGPQTGLALERFQKANNLPATGRPDKQTWILLRSYL